MAAALPQPASERLRRRPPAIALSWYPIHVDTASKFFPLLPVNTQPATVTVNLTRSASASGTSATRNLNLKFRLWNLVNKVNTRADEQFSGSSSQ